MATVTGREIENGWVLEGAAPEAEPAGKTIEGGWILEEPKAAAQTGPDFASLEIPPVVPAEAPSKPGAAVMTPEALEIMMDTRAATERAKTAVRRGQQPIVPPAIVGEAIKPRTDVEAAESILGPLSAPPLSMEAAQRENAPAPIPREVRGSVTAPPRGVLPKNPVVAAKIGLKNTISGLIGSAIAGGTHETAEEQQYDPAILDTAIEQSVALGADPVTLATFAVGAAPGAFAAKQAAGLLARRLGPQAALRAIQSAQAISGGATSFALYDAAVEALHQGARREFAPQEIAAAGRRGLILGGAMGAGGAVTMGGPGLLKIAAEVGILASVPAALEGRAITADDWIDAGVLVGSLKAGGKLRDFAKRALGKPKAERTPVEQQVVNNLPPETRTAIAEEALKTASELALKRAEGLKAEPETSKADELRERLEQEQKPTEMPTALEAGLERKGVEGVPRPDLEKISKAAKELEPEPETEPESPAGPLRTAAEKVGAPVREPELPEERRQREQAQHGQAVQESDREAKLALYRTVPATFGEFVQSQGRRWPISVIDPGYMPLRQQYDEIKKPLYTVADQPRLGQWQIINRVTGDVEATAPSRVFAQMEANRLDLARHKPALRPVNQAETKPTPPPVSEPAAVVSAEVKPDIQPAPKADAGGPHEFSSTQVDLPDRLAIRIKNVAARIPNEILAEGGREDRPHVTVLFGLHTADVAPVRELLQGEPPVRVRLGKLGVFKAPEHDVLYAEVESPDLVRLNQKLATLPNTQTFPEYKPHATIAYLKPGEGQRFVGDQRLAGQEATLDTVAFSPKEGGAPVAIKLGGGAAPVAVPTTAPVKPVAARPAGPAPKIPRGTPRQNLPRRAELPPPTRRPAETLGQEGEAFDPTDIEQVARFVRARGGIAPSPTGDLKGEYATIPLRFKNRRGLVPERMAEAISEESGRPMADHELLAMLGQSGRLRQQKKERARIEERAPERAEELDEMAALPDDVKARRVAAMTGMSEADAFRMIERQKAGVEPSPEQAERDVAEFQMAARDYFEAQAEDKPADLAVLSDPHFSRFGGPEKIAADYFGGNLDLVRASLENAKHDVADGSVNEERAAYGRTKTETPEFRRWFKESKAVNENGEPLVVYHSTNSPGFNRFDIKHSTEGGAFFFANPKQASRYAGQIRRIARGVGEEPEDIATNIMPAYLSIQNPLVVGPKDVYAPGTKSHSFDAMSGAISRAKKMGHDGLLIQGVNDAGMKGDQWVAFRPNQIKSATGNRGTFDLRDPNILHEERAPYMRTEPTPEGEQGLIEGTPRRAIPAAPLRPEVTQRPVEETPLFRREPTEEQGRLPGVEEGRVAYRARTETPEFRRWFGESKVVDEDGSPKVLYHGTGQPGFEAVDPAKLDPGALYGRGFYMTESPEVAGGKVETRSENRTFDTREEAEAAPGRNYFVWQETHGPDAGKFTTTVAVPTYAKRGYVHKSRPEALTTEDRRDIVSEFQKTRYYDLNVRQPGYLSVGEREMVGRHLKDWIETGNNYALDLLTEQPYNLRWLRDAVEKRIGQGAVYPIYAKIERPFDIEATMPLEEAERIVRLAGVPTNYGVQKLTGNPTGQEVYGMVSRYLDMPRANEILKRAGYDGITHMGGGRTGGEPHRVWIAFEPTQVKSATGNRGTFSPRDPNILHEERAPYGFDRELERRVEREYGITNDPERAGYVLRDGRQVDLGRSDSEDFVDHNQMAEEMVGGVGQEAITKLMRDTGMVRVSSVSGEVDLEAEHPLTPQQAAWLLREARAIRSEGRAALDVVLPDGSKINDAYEFPQDYRRFNEDVRRATEGGAGRVEEGGAPYGEGVPADPKAEIERAGMRYDGASEGLNGEVLHWFTDPATQSTGLVRPTPEGWAEFRRDHGRGEGVAEETPPYELPERTADTMSEAQDLGSPTGGLMSGRARKAALERQRVALFGPKGLPRPGLPKQPSKAEANRREAERLREMASRGMQPRKFLKRAEELEAEARKLEAENLPAGADETTMGQVEEGRANYGTNGYWIKPDGEQVRFDNRREHHDQVIGGRPIDQVVRDGWVRVGERPGIFGNPPTFYVHYDSRQDAGRRNAVRAIRDHYVDGPIVLADETDVNNLGGRFEDAREAIRYINSGSRFGGVEESRADYAPTFFSGLQKIVDEKMPEAAPAAMVQNIVKQAKPEEVKWTGIDDFLKARGGARVTKQEVQDFLKQNEVKVEEVQKGNRQPEVSEEVARIEQRLGELEQERNQIDHEAGGWMSRSPEQTERIHSIDREQDRLSSRLEQIGRRESEKTAPKFAHYTLPGGENYRELLLTLPPRQTVADRRTEHQKWLHVMAERYGIPLENPEDYSRLYQTMSRAHQAQWDQFTQQTGLRRGEEGLDAAKIYRSPHWDEPNVLAHIRFNDRTDADGKKVLFIEEIQSDWHQEGRRKGYAGSTDTTGWTATVGSKGVHADIYTVRDSDGFTRGNAIATSPEEAIRKFVEEHDRGKAPAAPFAKTWHELALKRVLRYAAENGYDKVAWTTGAQQAERYDLSKHIKSLSYLRRGTEKFTVVDAEGHQRGEFDTRDEAQNYINNPPPHMRELVTPLTANIKRVHDDAGPVYDLTARTLDGDRYIDVATGVKPEELDRHVGKEVANKILADEGEPAGMGGYRIEQIAENRFRVRDPRGSVRVPMFDSRRGAEAFVAEQLRAETGQTRSQHWRTLSGLDLKIGGEGMKGFYDRILPEFLNKYGKKWGARVGTTDLGAGRNLVVEDLGVVNEERQRIGRRAFIAPSGETWVVIDQEFEDPRSFHRTPEDAEQAMAGRFVAGRGTVKSIDITPAMKASVLQEGQALFERRAKYPLRPGVPESTRQQGEQLLLDLEKPVRAESVTQRENLPAGAESRRGVEGGSGVRTLGLAIRDDLVNTGRVELRGQIAKTAEDVATLAQIYRDPRYETLRIVWVDDAGTILATEGITSRLPGAANRFIKDKARDLQAMRERKERLGAAGYWMLHNHPSGKPTPSQADIRLTAETSREVPGLKGHVVIDSGQYGLIRVLNQGAVTFDGVKDIPAEEKLLTPRLPHEVLNQPVRDHYDAVKLGKAIQSPEDFATLLHRDSNGMVRAIQEMPLRLLERYKEAKDYIRGRQRAFGAPETLVYFPRTGRSYMAEETAKLLVRDGAILDAVAEVRGFPVSARESGMGVPMRQQIAGAALDRARTVRVEEEGTPYRPEEERPEFEVRDRRAGRFAGESQLSDEARRQSFFTKPSGEPAEVQVQKMEPPSQEGLTGPQVLLERHREVVDAAGEKLLAEGGVARDKTKKISDQILEMMVQNYNAGKDAMNLEMIERVLPPGMTVAEFGQNLWRPAVKDAARRLAALSVLERRINKMLEDGKVPKDKIAEMQETLRAARQIDEGVVMQAWWRRLDNIRRGLLVSQLATAIRNFESQVGRLGIDVLDQGLQRGLQKMAGIEKPSANPMEALGSIAEVFAQMKPSEFKRMKGEVDQILETFPREHDRLFGTYMSDVMAQAKREARGKMGPVGRATDTTLTGAEKVVDMLNWANKGQEYIVRRAVFQAHLDEGLRRKGLDLATLVKNGETGKIPEDVIKESVSKALELTFATPPKYGTAAWHFVKLMNQGAPLTTSILPFPRFMVNSLRFLYEFSPLGFAGPVRDLVSSRDWKAVLAGDSQAISRATIGTAMLMTAYAIRATQDDSNKWYEITLPGADRPIDVRPFNPFASYLFAADMIRRSINGTLYDTVKVEDILQGLASVNLRAGTGLYALDRMMEGLSELRNSQKFKEAGARAAGEYVAGFLTPMQQLKDVLGQFSDEMATVRDRGLEPFMAPIKEKIPGLAETLPPAYKPTRSEPIKREAPLLRQTTGITLGSEKNAAERELDRFQFERKEIMPRSGDPMFDNLYAKHLGSLVEERLVPYVESETYQVLSDAAKANNLRKRLTALRAIASGRTKKEMRESGETERLQTIREERRPKRERLFREERQRERETEEAAP